MVSRLHESSLACRAQRLEETPLVAVKRRQVYGGVSAAKVFAAGKIPIVFELGNGSILPIKVGGVPDKLKNVRPLFQKSISQVVRQSGSDCSAFIIVCTAALGERAELVCQEIRAVRWRGNSAQQMGRYGREGSRESIVIFEKR